MHTHDLADQLDPRHWYATNLVGVSSQLLASIDFNDFPQRLSIAGTRFTHKGLFSFLAQSRSQVEAADMFAEYMATAFSLDKRTRCAPGSTAHYSRSSYRKLLQGWGFDSNGPAGAVLKGWVESRFGIVPTFHKQPLEAFPSEAWMRYLEEKLSSRFHNNCIQLQLDILYEYAQWSSERRRAREANGALHMFGYRGMNAAEARFVKGSVKARHGVIRLNNLVSFSRARERAEEFGDIVVRAAIPLAKVLFFPGLLNDQVLNGEAEVLVIGGDFEVTL
ncbi:MAG: NAD(+)--dinitrogen-reductase ADP-D-ribosyltransferase [Polyangiales bacterium]